jgi:hypothetical protein
MSEEELKDIIMRDIKNKPELEEVGKLFIGLIEQVKGQIKEAKEEGKTQTLKEELEFLQKGKFMFKDRHYTNPQSKKMQKELVEYFDDRIKLISSNLGGTKNDK